MTRLMANAFSAKRRVGGFAPIAQAIGMPTAVRRSTS
jgi:hypothetical protein